VDRECWAGHDALRSIIIFYLCFLVEDREFNVKPRETREFIQVRTLDDSDYIIATESVTKFMIGTESVTKSVTELYTSPILCLQAYFLFYLDLSYLQF
jgi:hypothetical protein